MSNTPINITDAKKTEDLQTIVEKYPLDKVFDMVEASQGAYLREQVESALQKFSTSFMDELASCLKELRLPDVDGWAKRNETFSTLYTDLIINLEGETQAKSKTMRENYNGQVQKTCLNLVKMMR